MTKEAEELLSKLDHNLNDILFDLVDENETLEGQVNELREQVARLTENKGEWIYQEGVTPYKWRCNKCEKMFKTDFNYCPNCGANMKGGE